MKSRIAENQKRARETEQFSKPRDENAESENVCYARKLRALGQALEERRVSSLDLEVEGGAYGVRGKVTVRKDAKLSLSELLRTVIFEFRAWLEKTIGLERSVGELDLRFTAEEIEQQDRKGRANRRQANATPDPHSLSQILRGVGSYLDSKPKTSLVGVSVEDWWVTIRYKTADGCQVQVKQHIYYLYDYWVKMYLRRYNRSKTPSPGERAFMITWDEITKRPA